jgi:hypothetical protein
MSPRLPPQKRSPVRSQSRLPLDNFILLTQGIDKIVALAHTSQ